MNENFLGFQLAREEHNASIFYHEKMEGQHTTCSNPQQNYKNVSE